MELEPVHVTEDAEINFLREVGRGEGYIGAGFEEVDGEIRHDTIRAELVAALLYGSKIRVGDAEAVTYPAPAGVRVSGCKIQGELDISFGKRQGGGEMPALALKYCYIPSILRLNFAEIAHLSLYGSIIADVEGQGICVGGDVDISNVGTLDDYFYVDLRAADIRGRLWLGDMDSDQMQAARAVLRKLEANDALGKSSIEKLVQLDESQIASYAVLSSNNGSHEHYKVLTTIEAECMTVGGDLVIRDILLDDFYLNEPDEIDLADSLLNLTRSKVKSLKIEHTSQGLTQRLGSFHPTDAEAEKLGTIDRLCALVTFDCYGLIAEDFISFIGAYGNRNLKNARTQDFYDDTLASETSQSIEAIATRRKLNTISKWLVQPKNKSDPKYADKEAERKALSQWLLTFEQDTAPTNNKIELSNFSYVSISYPPEGNGNRPEAGARRQTTDQSDVVRETARQPSWPTVPQKPKVQERRAVKLKQLKSLLSHAVGFGLKKSRLPWSEPKIVFTAEPMAYAPQILMQLAKIEYESGDIQAYKDVMVRKNWIDLDIAGKKRNHWLSYLSPFRWVHRAIGHLFEFGYSPNRALLTLIVYLAIGTCGVLAANSSHMMVIDAQAVATTSWSDTIRIPVSDKGTSDIPCNSAISAPFYALDTMVPFLDLHQEDKCEIRASVSVPVDITAFNRTVTPILPSFLRPASNVWNFSISLVWMWAHALYAIGGWITTSLAILTFSGILRQKAD